MSGEWFVRCAHCGLPHVVSEQICPITGKPVEMRRRKKTSDPRPEAGFPQANEAQVPPPQIPHQVKAESLQTASSLIGQVIEGKYLVRELVGRGGMGAIYRAENLRLAKPVAIKTLPNVPLLSEQHFARMMREARITGSLNHPNIVEIYDCGVLHGQIPFVVFELLEGQTLSSRIELDGPLPLNESLDIVEGVLSGLAAAHLRGIVHRDLKPDNIFLDQRGKKITPKILDFGIAHSPIEETLSTSTGMIWGTPFYLAPEQIRGRACDHRVDLWAMGVIFYEMVTGLRPFNGQGIDEICRHILNEPPPPLWVHCPNLPREVEAVISKALERDPSSRYASVQEMLAAVRKLRTEVEQPTQNFISQKKTQEPQSDESTLRFRR
ncbi:MAG: serine/threonine protein kinase [Sandaracinaceae bacterium]|nr:serine/threonine protein kinase [Sandaracinaceae bacterium]MDW8246207.1 serine/threonine-protein kinase [Sandaracinaceae bacterium]